MGDLLDCQATVIRISNQRQTIARRGMSPPDKAPPKYPPNSGLFGIEDDVPYAAPWWFHSSPLCLDDPLAHLPKASLDEGTWTAFSERDCLALESKWHDLSDRLKRMNPGLPDDNGVTDELNGACQAAQIGDGEKNEEEADDVSQDHFKVIVGVERLHHVDLAQLRLSQ
jgi:hypothetical protein